MVKTIRIEDDTHEALDSFGERGETYNDILKRLLEIAKEKSKT